MTDAVNVTGNYFWMGGSGKELYIKQDFIYYSLLPTHDSLTFSRYFWLSPVLYFFSDFNEKS